MNQERQTHELEVYDDENEEFDRLYLMRSFDSEESSISCVFLFYLLDLLDNFLYAVSKIRSNLILIGLNKVMG